MKHTDGFGSEHHHWHPNDTDEYLRGAIERVRAARNLPSFLTYRDTGFMAEWFYQKSGDRTRYYTVKHVNAALRRAKQVDDSPAVDAAIATVKATKVRGWNTGKTKGAA